MRTQEAAGFIETVGFLPAVEAADVCLKTANVSLVAKHNSGGGLVTVIIRGDVGAVKAAVEAGTMAADRLGRVVSTHVIARPATELDVLLSSTIREPAPAAAARPEAVVPAEAVVTVGSDPESSSIAALNGQMTLDELKAHRTVELRNMARQLPDFPMSKQDIKFARKDALIQAMIEYHRR
ncbi:BMC domain-containing protein [Endozoicomonas acroporae]|uniref:BMC domain-containing protein n=1 Tax=Endozoicomonas acroporae TaxID=1701104 RepID=UPI000C757908